MMSEFARDQDCLKSWLQLFEKEISKTFDELNHKWPLCYSPDTGCLDKDYKESRIPQNRINLLKAMQYSSSGGKRIRPLLAASSYMAAGGRDILKNMSLIKFAISLEFIHSYSLIHDDLPALDNDGLRRGRPTCHIKYGEDMAIIAGDGLLNLSYEVSSDAIKNMSDEEIGKGLDALVDLSKLAGICGMIGGQAMDITEDILVSNQLIKMMVEKKTCALFMAAARIGARLAGADTEVLRRITSFAFNIGMAFQLRDDELDGEEDKKSGKVTLYNTLEQAGEGDTVKGLTDKALDYIKDLDNKEVLIALAKELIGRSH